MEFAAQALLFIAIYLVVLFACSFACAWDIFLAAWKDDSRNYNQYKQQVVDRLLHNWGFLLLSATLVLLLVIIRFLLRRCEWTRR